MTLRFSLTIVLFFLLVAGDAFAILVSPSVFDLPYQPGTETVFTMMVGKTSGKAELILENSTSGLKYVELLGPNIVECKDSCFINFKVTVPQLNDSPGKHQVALRVQDYVAEQYGIKNIGVRSAINAIIKFYVPFPGKYLEVKVSTADNVREFQNTEKMYFRAEVINRGKETIGLVEGKVHLLSYDGKNNYTAELTPTNNLGESASGTMYAELPLTDVPVGLYAVKSEVYYDGTLAPESVFPGVTVGSKLIKVKVFESNQFFRGKINPFSFIVESYWNTPLKVYALMELKDLQGFIKATGESKTIELNAYEQGNLNVFLDLSEVAVGNYTLEITSNYDQENHTDTFNVEIVEENIVSTPPILENNSVGQNEINRSSRSTILIIIVIVGILTFMGYFLYKKRKAYYDEESSPEDNKKLSNKKDEF